MWTGFLGLIRTWGRQLNINLGTVMFVGDISKWSRQQRVSLNFEVSRLEVLLEGSDSAVDCGDDALEFKTIGEAKYSTSASG